LRGLLSKRSVDFGRVSSKRSSPAHVKGRGKNNTHRNVKGGGHGEINDTRKRRSRNHVLQIKEKGGVGNSSKRPGWGKNGVLGVADPRSHNGI